MNVDATPVLALIAELYAVSQAQQARIAELEAELKAKEDTV